MTSVNKVVIIGRVGRDSELGYFRDGTPVTNLSVATSSQWSDKASGNRKEKTEWHRVVAIGKQAEFASQHATKGALVYVEGRLRSRDWKDQSGAKRTSTEIVADRIHLLSRKTGDTEHLGDALVETESTTALRDDQ
jgi:single-strand DNA-binding protein